LYYGKKLQRFRQKRSCKRALTVAKSFVVKAPEEARTKLEPDSSRRRLNKFFDRKLKLPKVGAFLHFLITFEWTLSNVATVVRYVLR
jgi:hypothetical protein